MAIDSAEKRKSISGIPGVPWIAGVTPNSGQDQEWRQESGWSYSGILATVIGGRIMSSLAAAGGLVGMGGLAGSGGGLAG